MASTVEMRMTHTVAVREMQRAVEVRASRSLPVLVCAQNMFGALKGAHEPVLHVLLDDHCVIVHKQVQGADDDDQDGQKDEPRHSQFVPGKAPATVLNWLRFL